MFEKEYKAMMEDVVPETALVEALVERQKQGKKPVFVPKAMKVAAAVLCGFLLLGGSVVAVDAATDGGIRKLFGLKNTVAFGTDKVVMKEAEPKRGQDFTRVGTYINDNGEMVFHITSSEDIPVFAARFEFEGDFEKYGKYCMQIGMPLRYCETKEDVAWAVYKACFTIAERRVREEEKLREMLIKEFKKLQEETGSGDMIKDGIVLGIQYAIDAIEAREGKNIEILRFQVPDTKDFDGDGDTEEIRGYAYYKVDKDAWEKESAETGKMEFVVEAMGGIPGKYLVTVKGYEFSTLYYSATPLE